MSISYSQKDIMVYELHWDITQDGMQLYSWMTNTEQQRWEVNFYGEHKKLLKIFNELNYKMFMGKVIFDPFD